MGFARWSLSASDSADDEKLLHPRSHRVRQRSIWRLKGQILRAGKETQHRTAQAGDAAKRWKAGLQSVKERTLGNRTRYVEFYLGTDFRQHSQMIRKYNADHLGILLSVIVLSRFLDCAITRKGEPRPI
jgi:hypothetical protein